jgi:hypothetical protein
LFTVDNFWDLLDAASGDTVDGLTDALDSLAKDSKAKGELYFDNVLGGAPPTTEPDWIRLRTFLLDWYAAHQTISAASSSVSDPRTLTNPDLDELFRSFGYDFSTQLKGPDSNPIDLKINFFLDLVNLYKRKGTPQAIVEVLQYYGVTKVDIFEFFIKLESANALVFEGTAIAGTTTNPSKLTFEYDRLTADDPHWLYTEAQILALQQVNDINLPSKTPYLGVQPVASIDGAEIGILIRIVQDQFQYYLDNGVPPTANAEVSEIGEVVSLLELYLSIIYIFNEQFNVGQVGDSFICYDGTTTNVTDIIDEFDIVTAKPTTRAGILTGLETFYDSFTRETPRDFLQNRSDAEMFLTMINPTLKSSLDSSTLTQQELLFSLMKDLSSWVRINLGYGFVNMGFIMFGLDSFFDDLKPVINFFKPYRARLLLLELLQINNPLFNSIIVEDTFEGVKVEFPIYDFVTGNGNPCCTNVDIDTTDCCTVCLNDSTTSLYYQRDTYDCNSYYDIGAVTDILQGDFFPMIYEIRHIHLVCIPPNLDSTAIVYSEVMQGEMEVIPDGTSFTTVIVSDSTAVPQFNLGDVMYQELTTGGFADFEGEEGISNGNVYDPADGTTVIALLYENHSSGTFDCPTAFDQVWITVYQESSSSSSSSTSSSSSSESSSSESSSSSYSVSCDPEFLLTELPYGLTFDNNDNELYTLNYNPNQIRRHIGKSDEVSLILDNWESTYSSGAGWTVRGLSWNPNNDQLGVGLWNNGLNDNRYIEVDPVTGNITKDVLLSSSTWNTAMTYDYYNNVIIAFMEDGGTGTLRKFNYTTGAQEYSIAAPGLGGHSGGLKIHILVVRFGYLYCMHSEEKTRFRQDLALLDDIDNVVFGGWTSLTFGGDFTWDLGNWWMASSIGTLTCFQGFTTNVCDCDDILSSSSSSTSSA